MLDQGDDQMYVVDAGVQYVLETDQKFKQILEIMSQEENSQESNVRQLYASFQKVMMQFGHYKVGYTTEGTEHVSYI